MRVFFLIISFIFVQFGWANIKSNIDAYLNFSYDGLDNNLIQQHSNFVTDYIRNYRGPIDKEYQGLLRLHANAQNYLILNKALSNCGDNERQLSVRILGVVGNKIKTVGAAEVPCRIYDKPFEEIQNFVDRGRDIISPMLTNSMQEDLYQRSIINSFKSLMHHKYQYGDSFLDDSKITKLIDEYCEGQCNLELYDPKFPTKSKLFSELSLFRSSLTNVDQYTASSVTNRLNELINGENGLNHILQNAEATIEMDSGIVWDSPEFTEATLINMQLYQLKYNQLASQDSIGRLLNTEAVSGAVGEPRKADSDFTEKEKGKFKFKKHKLVGVNQVNAGIEQVNKMIKAQIEELNEVDKNRKDEASRNIESRSSYLKRNFVSKRNEDLKKLLRTNPAAIGQQLFEKPFYAHKVCELIGEVSKDDEQEKLIDDIWFYGGMVVGGALLVTGIGAGVGAWVLAGTAASATLATVAATTGIVGTLVGLSEAGYHTHEYFEARSEKAAIEGAIMSGGGDSQSPQELQDSISDMRSAGYSAIMAGAFSAVELGTLYGAAKVYLQSAKIAEGSGHVRQAGLITSTLESISKSPKLIAMLDNLRRVVGSDKLAKFIGHLSNASEKVRIQILNRMANLASRGDLENVQRIVNEALEIAQKTCSR